MRITRDPVEPPPPPQADKTFGLGEHIRVMRQAARMTQGALGELTGFTRTTITMIELGKQGIDVQQLNTIAEALGYEVVVSFTRTRKRGT
jgi:transcriptional regulator with XRE-family HTH domain